MASDKIQMPSSGGGLLRYSDEFKSKIEISPVAVVVAIIVVATALILLNSGFF